ncbi:MAG TPA: chemotaxis protein CheD [Bryobacteraceae bacterium]|nr:chemotaxis protein CheD [Bryobacteraceae bacterium]
MSARVVVGIADCAVSADPEAVLVTYALGSCIGVAAWDPVSKVGGLLHYMLPDSSMESQRGKSNPYMYADTGVAALVNACVALGAKKNRLIVRAAGGAAVLSGEGDFFNIGKRNHLSLRKALWKAGVFVQAESVGGNSSRTLRLEVGSGRCWIHQGSQVEELAATRNQGVR